MPKNLYRSSRAERFVEDDQKEQEKARINKILDNDQSTPDQVDYKNKTMLFNLIEKKKWDRVVERMRTNPEEASIWVSRSDDATGKLQWRLLPLHSALYPVETTDADGNSIRCGIRAKIYVVEELLKVYPAAVLARDDQGMTPLHLASRNSAPVSVITKLLHMYAKGLEVQDNKGRTPLQLVNDSNTFGKERVLHVLNDYSYDSRMNHEVRDDYDGTYDLYGRGVAHGGVRDRS